MAVTATQLCEYTECHAVVDLEDTIGVEAEIYLNKNFYEGKILSVLEQEIYLLRV